MATGKGGEGHHMFRIEVIEPRGDGGNDGYYDLGDSSMPVTTSSIEAQKWFNRGLVWNYAFNHEEAVACFERAVAADPDCAMAYWGIAHSLGPNYNKPWGIFDERELERNVRKARQATVTALEKAASATVTPMERGFIDAIQHRYPQEQMTPSEGYLCNQTYAQAMERLHSDYPDDPNATALYVDALMNLTPWQMWDIRTGKPAKGARTLEAKSALEHAMSKHPRHPGMLHLYIHLMEMSSHPEQALNAADQLRGLVPDAGHLNHMPTHIDVLCGDYRRAIASNTEAVMADNKFFLRNGANNFYSLYRCHNLHFRIYAAMFAGQSAVALESAALLESTLPESLLRTESPPMADWLEGFLSMRVHVLVRFGRWGDILSLSLPSDQALYCTTTAMTHYARAIALANTGQLSSAEDARHLFHSAVQTVPESRTIFNNTCLDILSIASAMLDGEIEYRRGNISLAFHHLQRAITLDDSLPYDEPWGWMQPVRHAYGALLLEQGKIEEALGVYRADLGYDDTLPRAQQHRGNVWALHGLHECLTRLGREAEARMVRPQLELAMATADVEVRASCFCRRG